jgi:hypothetical protein
MQALTLLPELIGAGVDVIGLINQTNDSLKAMKEEGRDPSPEEWDVLNTKVEELRAQLPDLDADLLPE